jgi:hypothetical protein
LSGILRDEAYDPATRSRSGGGEHLPEENMYLKRALKVSNSVNVGPETTSSSTIMAGEGFTRNILFRYFLRNVTVPAQWLLRQPAKSFAEFHDLGA